MSSKALVPIYDPSGTLRDVPFDQMQAAVSNGGTLAHPVKAPDGTTRMVPVNRLDEAVKNGGTILPMDENFAPQHPGFWKNLYSDVVNNAEGMVVGAARLMQPAGPRLYGEGATGGGAQAAQQQMEQTAQNYEQRKAAGNTLPYRVAAAAAESTGTNVQGMEKSATEGDAMGVLGHAAAVPVTMAATHGITKAAPFVSDAVSDVAQGAAERATAAAQKVQQTVANVTPKQVAQVGGAAAGAAAGKGLFSAAGAYYGAKLGQVAEWVLGKDRANSPIFKSPDLSLDDITDALADTIAKDRQRFTEQQASGLGKLPQTGAQPAAQTGEALAGKPVSGGLPEPPTAGGKTGPRFTTADRAAAKSLLQDALSQSSKDVVDQALSSVDPATKLRTQSQVDLALQQGDIAKAEAAIKQANPAWTPPDRLPVPSVDEIRGRIQSQAQTPKGFSDVSEDNQILDSMRYDLNRHGWSAESEARREFIARNSTGMTKGELGRQAGMVGSEPKPVKLTKTPGVNTSAPGPDLNDPQVLMDQMQKTLDAIRQKKQQK